MVSTILIVDDEESLRDVLRAGFETCGFNVLVACDVAEGLALAAAHPIDAVITDFQMPHTDGMEFCRALRRAVQKHLPIWVMTGSDALDSRDACAAGAHGLFKKPFRIPDVAKKIAEYLAHSSANPDVSK